MKNLVCYKKNRVIVMMNILPSQIAVRWVPGQIAPIRLSAECIYRETFFTATLIHSLLWRLRQESWYCFWNMEEATFVSFDGGPLELISLYFTDFYQHGITFLGKLILYAYTWTIFQLQCWHERFAVATFCSKYCDNCIVCTCLV